jgi:PHP family Zn ribbon phosphoesterase
MASKGCWKVYDSLIEKFGNEFFILINVPEKDLNELIGPKLTELIIRNRNGNISVKPGYDGVYGEALIGKAEKQKKLF